MPSLHIDELIRSRRRSIGLTITRDARLIVRAPQWTPLDEIERLLLQKERWIRNKQEFFKRRPIPQAKQFVPGEEFLYLGHPHPLRISDDLPKAVVFDEGIKISAVAIGNAKDHLLNWYKQQALDYISKRVEHYALENKLSYKSIKVNDAKTRWGSCGFTGSLNFTWRLIMTPPRVIDYVVIHELMHLKQKNHSRKFWNEVSARIPDYTQDEAWLKINGHRLLGF